MSWFEIDEVLAGLRILGLGMAGIAVTTSLFILLTYLLRRAFPPKPESEPGEGAGRPAGTRSNEE